MFGDRATSIRLCSRRHTRSRRICGGRVDFLFSFMASFSCSLASCYIASGDSGLNVSHNLSRFQFLEAPILFLVYIVFGSQETGSCKQKEFSFTEPGVFVSWKGLPQQKRFLLRNAPRLHCMLVRSKRVINCL